MNFQVALFPIPDLVVFPGTIVPLHVFEPRYRQLVHDSVAEDRMVGLCHTRKQLRAARQNQTKEEVLSSNQATYVPFEVFSAGRCEIVEELDDGRINAVVFAEHRLVAGQEVQTLPYRVIKASSLTDERCDEDEARTLQLSVNARLIDLLRIENPEMAAKFQSASWVNLAAEDFSFQLFQYLRFDADVMQHILEQTTATARLGAIQQILDRAQNQ